MAKVYFGPWEHSPCGELTEDRRTLWFTDFNELREVDVDWWTNNPLALDVIEPENIMLWCGGEWRPMPEACDRLLPGWREDEDVSRKSPGKLALACDLVVAMIRFDVIPGESR